MICFGLYTLKSQKVSFLLYNYLEQLTQRLEKSFWEKLGFSNKTKEDGHLKEAKEKIDDVFRSLKHTVAQK